MQTYQENRTYLSLTYQLAGFSFDKDKGISIVERISLGEEGYGMISPLR
jgi:hypothetical protein